MKHLAKAFILLWILETGQSLEHTCVHERHLKEFEHKVIGHPSPYSDSFIQTSSGSKMFNYYDNKRALPVRMTFITDAIDRTYGIN